MSWLIFISISIIEELTKSEQTNILITTAAYTRGFECDAVVDFTSTSDLEPEIISRATIQMTRAPAAAYNLMMQISVDSHVGM